MALEVGQPAPAFALPDQHGQTYSLEQYRGKKNVAVMFYPFAFSSVCTGELREVRDNVSELVNDSTALLAVSCDPMFALRVFADRDALGFPLLSDFWPHGDTARAYGVFDEQRGCATRSSFIVDRQGTLRWQVSNPMPVPRDLSAYRRVLGELS